MKKLITTLLAAACVLAAPAGAQAFPSKPIHIIIPAAAGGPTDTIGRILGKVITEQYNVPVVVESEE